MTKHRIKKLPITTQADVHTLSHEGRGIAQINGKTTFIRGALAEETVLFTYLKKHRQYDEGLATDILKPAPERVTPQCEYFGYCGGCNLQHLTHDAQILHKQTVLLQQLKHIGKIIPQTILPPLTGPIWGYRHKARLGVKYVAAKNKVLVGFREINGRFLADIDACAVLHPAIGQRITSLQTLIQSLSIYDAIPQIEVAIGDKPADSTHYYVALILRHLEPFTSDDLDKLCHFAKTHQIKLFLQPGNADTIHRIWPKEGDDFLHYIHPHQKIDMRFEASDFTQVNPAINRQMIDYTLTLLELKPEERVLDLFCGLGNFTLPMAKHCKEAIGVEGAPDLVKRAVANAHYNHIDNAHFYSADLTKDLSNHPWANGAFDKILLDPPRTGALELMSLLPSFNAKRIVYISCNPATLSRDAGELVKKGYKLTCAGIMDMFPHTAHVESIAVFEKE